MQLVTRNNNSILHCANCGGSFFEENTINRISISTADKLAEDKHTDEISGKDKHCPKDHTLLTSIEPEESIPQDVTLLKCSSCKGIFIYPDDLVRLKRAQTVKIDYFKLWSKPLPSLASVLVLSLTAIVSVSLFAGYLLFQRQSLAPTQAEGAIQSLNLSKDQRYLFISFRTSQDYSSEIILTDTSVDPPLTIRKTIQEKPAKLHYLVSTDVNLSHKIYYQIRLSKPTGEDVPLPPPKELSVSSK